MTKAELVDDGVAGLRPHAEALRGHRRRRVHLDHRRPAEGRQDRAARLRQLPHPPPRQPHRAQPQDGRGRGRARQARPALQARQGAPGADQPAAEPRARHGSVGSLYLKDPRRRASSAGGLAEAEALFGSPLPAAAAARGGGGPRRLLRPASTRSSAPCSHALPAGAAARDRRRTSPARARGATRPPASRPEYEAALARMLRSVRADRPPAGAASTCSGWPTPATSRSACASSRRKIPARAQAQVLAAPAALVLLPAAGPGGAPRAVEQAEPGRLAFLTGGAREHEPGGRAASTTASPSPSCRSPTSTSTSSWPPTSATASSAGRLLRDLLRAGRARPSGGCARATAACWPGSPATCPACPSEQLQTPGRRGQGHDERARC